MRFKTILTHLLELTHRKYDCDAGPLSFSTIDLHTAPMFGDHTSGAEQSPIARRHPSALDGKPGLKQMGQTLGRNPFPGSGSV